MKHSEIIVVVVVALVLILVFGAALMPSGDKGQEKVATVTTNANATPSAIVPNDSTSTPAPEVTMTAEPETEKPHETTVNTKVYSDKDGKTYFIGQGALQIALDISLQQRLDYAVIESLKVYDIVRDTDVIVQLQGTMVTSRYALGNEDFPQEVEFLRDGYRVLAWCEDLPWDKTKDKSFATAKDDKFADQVFCKEHKAVRKTENVAFVNMEEGFRGVFVTSDLGGKELFDAWVLVIRDVEVDGQIVRGLTWCLNTCECEGTKKSDGGKKPVKPDPTKAPTTSTVTPTPTPAPTETPTVTPTPTPTPEGDNNPRETVRPTAPVGENNPRETVRPTASTVTDGNNNGRPEVGSSSDSGEGRPTLKPTGTGADGSDTGSDEGWSEDLPKVDPGF